MRSSRATAHLLCVILAAANAACAARGFTPPTDPGAPLPEYSAIHSSVSAACAGVRTFTAELGLSGRAGTERLRGRVVAGFARPDSMRLEGVAPLGPPAFLLAAASGTATLLLPRDNAVVRGAPADVLEALTGIALQPSDLQAVLTGCVAGTPRAVSGVLHGNGWASIAIEGGTTLYLERQGNAWQLRAARSSAWTIEYPVWQGSFPSTVRLRSEGSRVPVDVSATIAQLEANVDIDPSAFTLSVPPAAREISLDDLRDAGPLRGQP